ncbi:hypothetical protein CC117_26825 [Parafrankia colletiae]|uniref:DUF1990 domain-containing protein n=1 Tax=Parafrankia colletiae TaxID=573497 RepID=A0A1S1QBZ7_9ACTN|nr:DUF1990 domain-containing protein [Parafrankia colletiae]MCK9904617.1 DUF1990 domain-containing protein [Frankia sp. Cpl3]OHV31147.1 hypothetical protein CC117_26825 [Parafrankia colletiae]
MRLLVAAGLEQELVHCQDAELTYPERGATATDLPDGYRHLRRRVLLGQGQPAFSVAAAVVMSWGMHRRAGLRLAASSAGADVGATVVMCAGWGGVGVLAACRVVWVLDEPDRRGFAYGTLPDHPEVGEEAFVVERDADDAVWLGITAFSRPNGFLPRLAGPAGLRAQTMMTTRYARVVRDAVGYREV